MNTIIPFPQHPPAPFDYSAYNRRAAGRYRSHLVRFWLAAIIDCAMTAVIGVCVAVFTLVFLAIL